MGLKKICDRHNGLTPGLGYPHSQGEDSSEVHWDTVILPRLRAPAGSVPAGFRPNSRGWWRRDRRTAFADDTPLAYTKTENWNAERLQARGRLPAPLRESRVAILGVGALGSTVAELLVRAGLESIGLIDGEPLLSGNICRHVATLRDVGSTKVHAVGQRLLHISPRVQVTEVTTPLAGSEDSVIEALQPYDLVIDCTASDNVILLLAQGWWPIPKMFVSFSLGFGGRRLFSYGVSGNQFPPQDFHSKLSPWLTNETIAWAASDELLEGAGCWSPLFPARYDDVVMAAATCVKELEVLALRRPTEPRFRVFQRHDLDEVFAGFVVCNEPSATSGVP